MPSLHPEQRGEYESVTFCVRTLKDTKGLEVKTGRLV